MNASRVNGPMESQQKRCCESFVKQQTGYLEDSLKAPQIMDSWAAALLDASKSGSAPMLDSWSIKWSNRRLMLVVPFPHSNKPISKGKIKA